MKVTHWDLTLVFHSQTVHSICPYMSKQASFCMPTGKKVQPGCPIKFWRRFCPSWENKGINIDSIHIHIYNIYRHDTSSWIPIAGCHRLLGDLVQRTASSLLLCQPGDKCRDKCRDTAPEKVSGIEIDDCRDETRTPRPPSLPPPLLSLYFFTC